MQEADTGLLQQQALASNGYNIGPRWQHRKRECRDATSRCATESHLQPAENALSPLRFIALDGMRIQGFAVELPINKLSKEAINFESCFIGLEKSCIHPRSFSDMVYHLKPRMH